jgi:hypothetical protein
MLSASWREERICGGGQVGHDDRLYMGVSNSGVCTYMISLPIEVE